MDRFALTGAKQYTINTITHLTNTPMLICMSLLMLESELRDCFQAVLTGMKLYAMSEETSLL